MAEPKKLDNGKWLARIWIPKHIDADVRQPSKRFDRKKDAKKWINEKESEIYSGEYVEEEDVTMADMMDRWLEKSKKRGIWSSARTADRYEGLIRNHLKPELGHYKPENLSPSDIEDFYYERIETGERPDGTNKPVGFHSVRQMHNVLRETFKRAVKDELISEENSKMHLVDLPTDKKGETSSDSKRVYLNREEVGEFLKTARAESSYWIFWVLGFYTGARKSEIMALKYRDIDFDSKEITFERKLEIRDDGKPEFGEQKTENAERTISAKPELLEAIRSWKTHQRKLKKRLGDSWSNDHDLICTSKVGTPIRNIRRDLRNLKEEIDIKPEKLDYFSIHDMRHTHASLILNHAPENEGDRYLKIASQRLGHCNVQFTLNTYSEVAPQKEEDVANEALEGIEIEI